MGTLFGKLCLMFITLAVAFNSHLLVWACFQIVNFKCVGVTQLPNMTGCLFFFNKKFRIHSSKY